jgi:zinc transporter ZupT
MAVALLLTCLAMAGVMAGALLERSISHHVAAAGGLLLFGVAFIWIVPEIAELWSWPWAVLAVTLVAVLLALLDGALVRLGHSPRHGVIAPLLAATAIHSLLDGWSIRTLATHPLTEIFVPTGLALHKIPEGFVLGLVLRRTVSSPWRAAFFGISAELFTLLGALLQPPANRSGLERFGPSWTPAVLSVIAGAFVFLGCHALLPYFRRER